MKNKAYKRYCKSEKASHLRYYKDIKNLLSTAIKNEKTAYFRLRVNQHRNNPQKMWKTFAELNIHKKPACVIPNDLKDVEGINKFFIQQAPAAFDIDTEIQFYSSNKSFRQHNSLKTFSSIDEDHVSKTVQSLASNAYGLDGIGLTMVKFVLPYAVSALTHILNFSLENGVVPISWKKSLVVPLPKNLRVGSFTDLRPISVLPTMSKVLEKIVYGQFVNHLKSNDLLPAM